MKIPFSPPDITETEIEQVAEALRSGWITTGPKTKELEREVADLCGTNRAVCLNSQTACAEMTLRLLGIHEGDEVITCAYTYTASASVVCHVGAKLVLIDTQEDSLEMDYDKLAEELGIGAITLQDIVKELEKPARDPREDMPKPILRSDVLEMKDLTPGMVLKGTVRNVIDFGAFVDIGVHQDGLVHISQMSDKFIKHPLEVVSVGDIVEVKVMSVDLKKQRIQLTMKL